MKRLRTPASPALFQRDDVVRWDIGCAERGSEEHTSELQSRLHLVCRLLLEKKKTTHSPTAAQRFTTLPQPRLPLFVMSHDWSLTPVYLRQLLQQTTTRTI